MTPKDPHVLMLALADACVWEEQIPDLFSNAVRRVWHWRVGCKKATAPTRELARLAVLKYAERKAEDAL